MFIAQIKPPSVTLHPVVGLVPCARRCGSLAGCLRLQSEALSRAPGEVTGRETELSNARGCYKACCIKAGKHLDEITSGAGGAGGAEEARSAALGEDDQVLKALSAASLMLVLCTSCLLCLSAQELMDPGASSSLSWTGRRQSVMETVGCLL